MRSCSYEVSVAQDGRLRGRPSRARPERILSFRVLKACIRGRSGRVMWAPSACFYEFEMYRRQCRLTYLVLTVTEPESTGARYKWPWGHFGAGHMKQRWPTCHRKPFASAE